MSILPVKYDPFAAPLLNTSYANASVQSGVNTIVVFEGVEGQQFNFATFVTHFNGKLFYIWAANDANAEDAEGQWIRYAIIDPVSKTVEHRGSIVDQNMSTWHTACGLWVRDGELYALTRTGNNVSHHRFISVADGWEDRGLLFNGYLTNEAPIFHNGKWHTAVRNSSGTFIASGDIGKWTFDLVPQTSGNSAIEPTLLFHRGVPNLILRNNSGTTLYRHYNGVTESTNYPDARSKSHRIRLDDGRVLMFGNAITYKSQSNRTILHMGISNDGLVVDKLKIFRQDPPPMKWGALASRNGWNYPNATVHDGVVYVASALNKQDVVLDYVSVSAI